MSEQNKTIWEIPPREPIPRQEVPTHRPDHPERQSEGTTDSRHKNDSYKRSSKGFSGDHS
jgi:hypothetical protein